MTFNTTVLADSTFSFHQAVTLQRSVELPEIYTDSPTFHGFHNKILHITTAIVSSLNKVSFYT